MYTKQQRADYMRARYHRKRAEYIAMLGGACSVCGSKKELELDHVDRTKKSFCVSTGISNKPKAVMIEELKKCQVLCAQHHMEKTLRDRGQSSARGTHGTLSSYRYCKCDLCRAAKAAWYKQYTRPPR